MPIIELGDGRRAEVDDSFLSLSPEDQQRTVDEIAGHHTWGETFAAAKKNLTLDKLAQASFTNPIEDVKNLGKAVLGGAEHALGFTPEQQISNEQQVASDVGRHYTNYLTEEGRKENVSQDPIGTMQDVLSFGLAPAQKALNIGRRVITPNPARPGYAEAHAILQSEGVPQTAGQATGRRGLKYAESELGGGATMNLLDAQAEGYTRAASRRIGEDSPHLDTATINHANRRIGNDFDQVGLRNNIPPDPQLAIDLGNAAQTYIQSVPIAAPGVQNMAQAIAQRGAVGLTGRAYNQFRSRLSRLQRNTSDPELQNAYLDMRNALDDAMERSLTAAGNRADLDAFRTARQQWRNLIVLQDAMATGPMAGRGLLTPQHLEAAAAKGRNRSWYARGLSDFSDLGKAGRVGMEAMPESGTAVRGAIRGATALAGGLLAGGGALSPEAVAGTVAGLAAPPVMGRALMSRPAQAYLGNQLMPGTTRIPGQVAAPAVAVGNRRDKYSNAERVLTKPVLDQVKKFAAKEFNAWLASGSPTDLKTLAETIAAKVNRPDLVERIIGELSAQ